MRGLQLVLLAALVAVALAKPSNRDASNRICFEISRLKMEIGPFLSEFTLEYLNVNMNDAMTTFYNTPLRDRLRYLQRFTWLGRNADNQALLNAYELALSYEIALKNVRLDVALFKHEWKTTENIEKLVKLDSSMSRLVGILKDDRRIKDHPEQRNEKLKSVSNLWNHVPVSDQDEAGIKIFLTLRHVKDGLDEFERLFKCEYY